MKKFISVIIAAVLIGTLAGCSNSSNKSGTGNVKTIIIGTMPNAPKTSYLDDKGNLTGFEVELLKEIDKRIPGYKFEFKTMEGASLFPALESKKVDLVTGNFRKSSARQAKYLYTSEPYNYTPYRIIVLKSNNTIKSLDDLKGKTVGVGQGSLQSTILHNYSKANGNNIKVVYTGDDYISQLQTGRMDAIIFPDFGVAIMNETANAGVKAVGDPVASKEGDGSDQDAYFIMRKDETQLQKEMDKAIKAVKKDGTLKKLDLTWFNTDYSQYIEQGKGNNG